EDFPLRLVAEFRKPAQKIVSVMFEFGRGKARNILEKNRPWFDSLDKRDGCWEHVAVVVGAKLFAGDAEWGAGNTASQKVYPGIRLARKISDIFLESVPVGAIFAQSR